MTRTRAFAAVAIPVATIGFAAILAVPAVATASTSTSSVTATGGSISLTLTSPRAINRSHAATVACSGASGTYHATAKATVRGVPIRVVVSVPSYDGPGSYSDSTVSIVVPGKTIAKTPKAAADLTATGGSFSFDRTTKHGVEIAGTAGWTCSTAS